MPHYFFHMAAHGEQLCDENGTDFQDLSAAYQHALDVIQRAIHFLGEEDTSRWMINIATADGAAPLTVLFPPCIVAGRANRTRNASSC